MTNLFLSHGRNTRSYTVASAQKVRLSNTKQGNQNINVVLSKPTASCGYRPGHATDCGPQWSQGRIQSVFPFEISSPLIIIFLVRDLATRFSDGRLSTEKLLKSTDEELSEMLIEIYGVGKVRFAPVRFS